MHRSAQSWKQKRKGKLEPAGVPRQRRAGAIWNAEQQRQNAQRKKRQKDSDKSCAKKSGKQQMLPGGTVLLNSNSRALGILTGSGHPQVLAHHLRRRGVPHLRVHLQEDFPVLVVSLEAPPGPVQVGVGLRPMVRASVVLLEEEEDPPQAAVQVEGEQAAVALAHSMPL
mmetsp:Transcript_86221/g.180391  ORF Transcript_86221/g.180391 Transcript_86221/m.180391 type:complete len:169 (-) Transcript_86221:918-1424(-)